MQPPFSEGRYEADGAHHGGPLPSCCRSEEETGGSGLAVAHSRTGRQEQRGRRRRQLGVERVRGGAVTPALGGGSPPAVPIWGEKRPRGSSISSRDGPGPEWPMAAAAEQKHTLPLFQHQRPSTLNYFSGKEVFGQWTQPLKHWFILYTSFFLFSVK